jgi:3-oxoadipate enol-lactonase
VPTDRDELPVAWREDGPFDGDLVVLLHGLGGSRISWEPQLASLGAAGFRAAAWDMPGYGASEPPSSWTFEALAAAAAAWIGRLDGRAHVVGLSLGGMVSQHLALDHPATVRSLVLCDSSPAFGLDGTTRRDEWVGERLAALEAGGTPAAIAPSTLRSIMAADAHGIDSAVAAMARIAADGLAGAIRCLPSHDVRDRLDTIDVPTLVVVGEHDAETPRSYSEHLASSIRGARLAVIPGAGHLSNVERPDAFDAALLAFLTANT